MKKRLERLFEEGLSKEKETAYQLNYYVADNPELSGEEFKACAKYVEICKQKGMNVEENFCGLPTAFKATVVQQKNPKAKMAILAEYDALPGLGHGCGHSASGSISLLTALSLRHLGDSFNVAIDLIGTPDEEQKGMKVDMVNQGVFKEYDFAMMVHLNSNQTTPTVKFLALSGYKVKFFGKTSHAAASPWEGISALNGARLAMTALDLLRQVVKPETRISYKINKGGEAANIIPDYAEIEVDIRSGNAKDLALLKEKVQNCVKGAALATNTTYEIVSIGNDYRDVLMNTTGEDIIREVLEDLDIPYVESIEASGSSDIGNVSYECPAFHPMLATSESYFPLHTKEMVDVVKSEEIKDVIDQGARLIGHTMIKLIENPNLMKKMKEEFVDNTK